MPLTKAKGNMYPWVTHLWNPIYGPCPHACTYCYVKSMRRVKQPTELTLKEPFPALGKGKTIFVGHMNDLFAAAIPPAWRERVLEQCYKYDQNDYVFQSKNVAQMITYGYPRRTLLGTTIETNRQGYLDKLTRAPHAHNRLYNICQAQQTYKRATFITVEPIMDFDVDEFARMLIYARPDFINIGADSKGHNLPEPTQAKVGELIAALKGAGIEVRLKDNLKRLFPW